MISRLFLAGFLVVLVAQADLVTAQRKDCPPPTIGAASSEPNIFSQEQEEFLGDAAAENIQKDYKVIDAPAVTNSLTQIGARLTKNLPLTKLRFQFFLVELP